MVMEAKLSVTDQLAIIKEVKAKLQNFYENGDQSGLCYLFYRVILEEHLIHIEYTDIRKYIPLFTKQNAIKHAHGDANPFRTWWWDYWKDYDLTNRMLFLDWMEKELLS